jgi:malonyl-CoA/methylmalonyl-CoA synthetase
MARTILAALDVHADRTPEAPAIDATTYAALRRGVARVANRLAAAGLRAGERFIIYAENRPGFIYAYLAGMRLGAVVVPANVLYRAGELEHVIADAGARAIAVSEQSAPHLPAAAADLIRVPLADVEAWFGDPSIDEAYPAATSADGDVAILIYTSGTTGRAKGAMLTHGNLGAIAAQVNAAWRWTAADRLLLTLPLFHVHGLGAGLNGTLAAGAALTLRERFDAGYAIDVLARGEATMFFGVPTMYVRFLEQAPPGTRFDRVRLFVSGSAALPASVHEAFEATFGASILERYGSTEFGFALGNRYEGPRFAGTVGFPLPDVRIRLDGPDGEAGEVLVNGPNVCAGYWGDPEKSAAAFLTDPDGARWFKSGDLATFDPERGYTICGRLKDLIISGGFNIYPSEVEDELLRVPGIRAGAIVGRPDDARGEVPVAFVEADDPFEAAVVIETMRDRLASFKVPKAVYRLDALPRNAMGKVEKTRLRAMLADGLAPA